MVVNFLTHHYPSYSELHQSYLRVDNRTASFYTYIWIVLCSSSIKGLAFIIIIIIKERDWYWNIDNPYLSSHKGSESFIWIVQLFHFPPDRSMTSMIIIVWFCKWKSRKAPESLGKQRIQTVLPILKPYRRVLYHNKEWILILLPSHISLHVKCP